MPGDHRAGKTGPEDFPQAVSLGRRVREAVFHGEHESGPMKALVLAGGSGTRLRPLSYVMPKQLVPVAGEPLLFHTMRNLREIGVRDVAVVVGDWHAEIADALGDGRRFGLRITYLRQDRPRGLAHCVRIARPFLGSDDFVMCLGDNFLPDGIAGLAADFMSRRPAAQIAVRAVDDPRAFGVAETDGSGVVRRLVEKPAEPVGNLAVLGVYFFTEAIHAAVERIRPGARGELEITDAVQSLVTAGATVRAGEYDGYWADVGHIEDVLRCNRHALDQVKPELLGEVDDASETVGAVALAPGARLVRSHVEGPAIIGPGADIVDSKVGPNVVIGRECTIQSTRLGDCVVLDGGRMTGLISDVHPLAPAHVPEGDHQND
jgi:glucose-1-phosphate thymidylyltransferase